MRYILISLLMLTACSKRIEVGECYIDWERTDDSYVRVVGISPNGFNVRISYSQTNHTSFATFRAQFIREEFNPIECPKETK